MAPAPSRIASSHRSIGLGLLAAGGIGGAQLFAAPGVQRRGLQQQHAGRTPTDSMPMSSMSSHAVITPCSVMGLALAGAGAAATRKTNGRTQTKAASAQTAEPPPPFNAAKEVGALAPVGYFDPLGFCSVGDEDGFRKLRAAELKHGRVAMMASVGLLGQHFLKFPGFDKTPAGFGAIATGEGVLGMLGLFIASAVLELAWREQDGKEPGNFGDPFGLNMYTEDMRNKEISNGRFAMICVFGIFAAEMVTGKDAMQQFAFSAFQRTKDCAFRSHHASAFAGVTNARTEFTGVTRWAATAVEPPPPPPFSPAEEVGAMAPLGYFDPLGFCSVGDEAGFRKLRASELKHGRVAMMASVGLLGQHFIKFPGFEKTPAGAAAIATGEGVFGMLGIFIAAAVLELAWREQEDKEPGNFGDPFGVKMYNEEMRTKEISNGRFAMLCVIGIFAAEVATGKDAIQQLGLAACDGGKAAVAPRTSVSTLTGRTVMQTDTASRIHRAAAAVQSPAEPPFDPATQVGALAPLGYFDPLGFCSVGDEAGFRKLRASELKHGRVAMMASVGLLGQHFIKFPGFDRVPAGFAAVATGEGVLGLVVLLATSAFLELAWREQDGKEPGNFGDPFGVNMYNSDMRNKEISNGRFAMICVLGIFAAELGSGKDAIQQFGF